MRKEPWKIGIELRLAADELNLAATEIVRLIHDRFIIERCQQVLVPASGVGLGIAVNTLQIASVGQFQPKEIETSTFTAHLPFVVDVVPLVVDVIGMHGLLLRS
ncbi:hypothetical protein VR45_34325 [Streptomyces sp. NRRL S-495]|nr:hypothetical protein VR45_34325 [Streptomyces sp. NRRL S-495]